jgi:zinc transport system ATP-binding protein
MHVPAADEVGFIRFRDAALGYRGHIVLPSVNLEIGAGTFVVVLGPNGGGKSTLLKSTAGLIPLLGGTRDVGGLRFGYVPQQAAVDPPLPMTALEMVQLGSAAVLPHSIGFRRREAKEHLDCLARCESAGLAHRAFRDLSGGQRQRVLIARALAVNPNALLLDEPTAGVDRETQHAIAKLLGAMNRETRLTVVLVTHDHRPFAEHATRYLRVDDGRIESNHEGAT